MGSAVLDLMPTVGPRAAAGVAPAGVFPANATLIRRVDVTPSVARFVLLRDGPARAHLAGQYLAVGLWVDGRLLQRPYSTASPPTASEELEFLIRRVPHGSLTPRLWELPLGARLRVGPPKGLLTLDPRPGRTAVFAATGTGLAPIISMLAAALDGPPESCPPRLVVLHGVAYAAELAYRDRLEHWAATHPELVYEPVISRPGDPLNAGWSGAVGHLDGALDAAWRRHRLDPRETVAYLCGNPAVIAAATRLLGGRGVPPDAIVAERYWTAPMTGPSALDRAS
jgi:ferredoxin-NADP reductase